MNEVCDKHGFCKKCDTVHLFLENKLNILSKAIEEENLQSYSVSLKNFLRVSPFEAYIQKTEDQNLLRRILSFDEEIDNSSIVKIRTSMMAMAPLKIIFQSSADFSLINLIPSEDRKVYVCQVFIFSEKTSTTSYIRVFLESLIDIPILYEEVYIESFPLDVPIEKCLILSNALQDNKEIFLNHESLIEFLRFILE